MLFALVYLQSTEVWTQTAADGTFVDVTAGLCSYKENPAALTQG